MIKKFIFLFFLSFYLLQGCSSVGQKEEPVPGSPNIETAEISEPVFGETSVIKSCPILRKEKLVYKAKFLGFGVGDFIIENKGEKILNGREVYQLELTVKTLSFFAKLFKTKSLYVSYLDAKDFKTLRYEEYIKDGSMLETAVDFNYSKKTASCKNLIDHTEQQIPIPDQVLDVISGGFFLKTLEMESGESAELNVYFDHQIYRFVGLLREKTSIGVPGHGRQEAYRFKPNAYLNGKKIKKASAEVFLSSTSTRQPLRAVLKAPLGSVSVVLIEGFEELPFEKP